jgi:hypothetical protein
MSDTEDIVTRLRVLLSKCCIAPAMGVWSRDLRDAADEIERLRAERDEARAEVVDRALGYRRDVPWDKNAPERLRCMEFAQQRGWHDLFSEINAKVDAMNTAQKGKE